MNDERDGALEGLDDLYADREPPPGLEDRVAASFARSRPGSRAPTRGGGATSAVRWLQLAAGLTLLLGGYGAGRLASASGEVSAVGTGASASGGAGAAAASPGYLFLLWEDERFARQAPPGGFAAEYAAWARAVAEGGVGISGHELGPDRAVVGGPRSAGDLAGAGGTVSGYFVVQVDDLAAARRLAEGHPHVGHGGWIEVAEMR